MSLSHKVVKGTAILTVSRAITRAFSLVSILTVARWLGPEEMGVFGVASLMLATIDQLTETGLRSALIQRQGNIGMYIVPVRTVQAVRGLCLGLLVFVSAPLVAEFFGAPKALEILRVIALVPVIQGLEPIFETLARKDLNFGPIVRVQIASGLVGMLVGIATAYLKPDAWALVYATLSRVAVSAFAYYWISEQKYRGFSLQWASLKDLHSFGFWVFINTLASYFFIKGGDWAIGRMLSIQELALYQMAFLVTTVVTGELAAILSSIMLPVFSKLQNEQGKLSEAFGAFFGIISIVTFLMAALVCGCSPDFYRSVLGVNWISALKLVPWLTVWGVCSVFAGALGGLMQALNRPKLWAQTVFLMVGCMGIGIYPMTLWLGSTGVAVLMAGIGIVMQLLRYWLVARIVCMTYWQVLGHIFVPLGACLLTVSLVRQIISPLIQQYIWTSLVLSAVSTIAIFSIIIVAAGSHLRPTLGQLFERVATMRGKGVLVSGGTT